MFPRNENSNKGTFGCSPGTKTGTRVHSDVPPERKPERGHVRMFPWNENRNEGTFAKTTLLRNRPFVSRWRQGPKFVLSLKSLVSLGFEEREPGMSLEFETFKRDWKFQASHPPRPY